MKKLLALSAVAFSLFACGPGPSNVAACKKFLMSASCGSVDVTSSFNCDSFKDTTCDVSEYFNCASSHYVCTNGMYDTAKLSSFSTDCASKAVCK